MSNFQEKVTFIWDLADLLRGVYKRNEYQKIILPFTVLKRFDSVLSDSKREVLEAYNKYKKEFENIEPVLQDAAKDKKGNQLGFYNYSKYDFKTLLEDPDHIEQNLVHYIDCFSKNVQDIFENFKIKTHIENLAKANLLFLLIKKFSESKVDLHPDVVSNHEMGTIFEELIRKFAEQSNEEAGEHFTPRDVVELMTKLMFIENDGNFKSKSIIKTVYDPACGTGGMLTSCKDFINSINKSTEVVLFGQELNPEIYAICKADMLMKGENSENIRGPISTLSKDQFSNLHFDYIISNPPYGTKWEQDQEVITKEAEKGFDGGRFGAGLPRINDGQLLFLQHMISKMKPKEKSRIAVITNGSPLFTGDAGAGESDIRKWMIENDLVEAIIALPNQLFYNTGITTYVWVLTNNKPTERVGKIQLVNAINFFKKMRRSLGYKRNYLCPEDIEDILKQYDKFEENEFCKLFENEEFGYTKVIVERPLQLNYQISEERLENLYSINSFSKLAESKKENPEEKLEGEEAGKKKQEEIINALKKIGDKLYKNWDEFEKQVQEKTKQLKLTPGFVKNIILALSEHDETAEYVLDNKGKKKPDSNLKDSEKIPLKQNIKEYFEKEVLPYYSDAWMDRSKDKRGYEINFTKYFYKYVPPRKLEDIENDMHQIILDIENSTKKNLFNNEFNINKDKENYGFEFVKEIPKNWELKKLKYVKKDKKFSIVDGPFGTQLHNDEYVEEGIPVVRVINLDFSGKFNPEKLVFITPEKYKVLKRSSLKEGDLIIAKTGATIGKMGVFNGFQKGIISSSCIKFSPDIKKYDSDFMKFGLISDIGQSQINLESSGSTRDTINIDPFSSMKLVMPKSKEEQKKISSKIKTKLNEIDELMNKNKKMVCYLKEYKKSLIYGLISGGYKIKD